MIDFSKARLWTEEDLMSMDHICVGPWYVKPKLMKTYVGKPRASEAKEKAEAVKTGESEEKN